MLALQTEPAIAVYGTRSPVLPVMVVLGNPKNPDCSQHGICRIYESGIPHEPCRCRHQTFAWLRCTDTGSVSLVFPKNFIRPEAMEAFFSGERFIVPEAYCFPERLALKMRGAADDIHIQPGAYEIIRSVDCLEVRFEPC